MPSNPSNIFIGDYPIHQFSLSLDPNAWQTSVGWAGVAGRAVDGNTANDYNEGSCIHNRPGGGDVAPWWYTYQGRKLKTVTGVTITNRKRWSKYRFSYQSHILCAFFNYSQTPL